MLIGMGSDAVRVKGMDRVWMGGNGGCLGVDKVGKGWSVGLGCVLRGLGLGEMV